MSSFPTSHCKTVTQKGAREGPEAMDRLRREAAAAALLAEGREQPLLVAVEAVAAAADSREEEPAALAPLQAVPSAAPERVSAAAAEVAGVRVPLAELPVEVRAAEKEEGQAPLAAQEQVWAAAEAAAAVVPV